MRWRRCLPMLAVATLALSSGYETTERILNTAEQAVTSNTGRDVFDIAQSKDVEEALRRRAEGYARAARPTITTERRGHFLSPALISASTCSQRFAAGLRRRPF